MRDPKRAFAVALAIVVLAAACKSGKPERAERQTLRIGTTEQIATSDPAGCTQMYCASLLLPNTHRRLTALNGSDGSPVADLATSWTPAADGLSWTFKLGDATFSNGRPVTAADVRASLDRVRTINAPDGPFSVFYDRNSPGRRGINALETPDDKTILIRLIAPDAAFPARMAHAGASIVPADAPTDKLGENAQVLGAGPFTVRSATSTSIELARRSGESGPKTVTIRSYPSPNALAQAVAAGNVDVAFGGLGPAQVQSLRAKKGVKAVTGPGAATRFLVFNASTLPFSTFDMRAAVAAAVDRSRVTDQVLARTAKPLFSLVPNGLAGAVPAFKTRGESGKEAVERHLAAAGIASSDKVNVDLWYSTHYGEAEAGAAGAIRDALQDTGRYTVTLRSAEWAEYKAALARGQYGMFLLGWYPDVLDADDYLWPFVSSSATRTIGSFYASAEADDLLRQERATTDGAARRALVERIQDRIATDVPYVPLWQLDQVAVVRSDVRGVRLDMSQTLQLSDIS